MKLYFESELHNKVSLKDFTDNVPPRFIRVLESYFDINSLYIFQNKYNTGDFVIETKHCECYLCKKNINYKNVKRKLDSFILNKCDILNENILYKIDNIKLKKEKQHRVFVYETKINSNIYLKCYYHLCNECFENSLYYWYITYNNKYPFSRIDGFCFIHKNDGFVPEVKSIESLNKIKHINFPMIFKCEYYNNSQNKYNFMDN
tara:strand:+ start:486 stop:1097 length:612 start_codon:yes stop_codon:yes gene_type:complete